MPSHFDDYASYHRTRGNQLTHLVGIPLIVIGVLGLLAHLTIGVVDGGIVIWLLGMLWYLKRDWRLAIPFGPTLLGLYFFARALPVWALATFFIVGWAVQYVGHYVYEKKAPAFYKNAEHLLVGPFWLFAKITGYRLAS